MIASRRIGFLKVCTPDSEDMNQRKYCRLDCSRSVARLFKRHAITEFECVRWWRTRRSEGVNRRNHWRGKCCVTLNVAVQSVWLECDCNDLVCSSIHASVCLSITTCLMHNSPMKLVYPTQQARFCDYSGQTNRQPQARTQVHLI